MLLTQAPLFFCFGYVAYAPYAYAAHLCRLRAIRSRRRGYNAYAIYAAPFFASACTCVPHAYKDEYLSQVAQDLNEKDDPLKRIL